MALSTEELKRLMGSGGWMGIPGASSGFNEMGPSPNDFLSIGGNPLFNEMADPTALEMTNVDDIWTLSGVGPSTGTEPTFNAPNRSTESFLSSFSNIRNLLGIGRPQNRPIGRVIEDQLLRPETSPGFKLGQNLLSGRQKTRQQDLAERLRKSGIGLSGPALQMSNMIEREGDIDIGNLGLAAGELGVQNALKFEPLVQGTFLKELGLGAEQSELSKTRELLRDIARSGSQAGIGQLIAALLGGKGGIGGGLLDFLLGKGTSDTGLLGSLGKGGKAIFDWLTSQGTDPNDFLSLIDPDRLSEDVFGESAEAIFGPGSGGGGGGGAGGIGVPPIPPSLIEQITNALGITGVTAATTAATFPAFLSSIDAALAAAGIAPLSQAALASLASQFGAGLPAAAASLLAAKGGAAGAAGIVAPAATTGAEVGGGSLAGTLGALAIPFGALGLAGMLTGGFKAGSGKKDIKESVESLRRTMKIVQQARISGQPIRTEDIGGYLTAQRVNQQNQPFGGYGERAIEIAGTMIANALNAGTNIQPQNGRYIVPMMLDKLTYQAGGRADPLFGATPSGQPEPFSVSIPASEVIQQRSGRWTTESIIERKEKHKQESQDRRQGERSDD